MKKHIFGLLVFSFIVAATMIVYGFFNVSETATVGFAPVKETASYIPEERTHCKMKISNYDSIEVKQAVFNMNTKEFNWELAVPDRKEMIDLQFFSKDARGTRYITTERVSNKISRMGTLRFTNSYNWLNKRNGAENLYVIARFDSDSIKAEENTWAGGRMFEPKFDSAKAAAVTVDYGK